MCKRILSVCPLALSLHTFAQDSFEEFVQKDISKIVLRHHTHAMLGLFDDGHETVPNLKGKELPKRIALVSFYIFDRRKSKSYSYTTHGAWDITITVTKTIFTSLKNTMLLGNVFLTLAAPNIIAEFKAKGMEVLLPDQYLTDDAKRNAYANFQPEISGLSKSLFTKDDDFMTQGGAEGFLVKPVWAPFDFKQGHRLVLWQKT
ncbi:MAG: hypothetical protein C4329_04950 [Chitinophagaceae bacterium]